MLACKEVMVQCLDSRLSKIRSYICVYVILLIKYEPKPYPDLNSPLELNYERTVVLVVFHICHFQT